MISPRFSLFSGLDNVAPPAYDIAMRNDEEYKRDLAEAKARFQKMERQLGHEVARRRAVDEALAEGGTLAERIKRVRRNLGWSQSDLRDMSEVSLSSIQKIEQGQNNTLTWRTIQLLAKCFGCSTEDLKNLDELPLNA